MSIKVGKPDTKPDAPAHTPGVSMGNATGNYEKMDAHLPDGRSKASRSTGVDPGSREPVDPRMPNLSPA